MKPMALDEVRRAVHGRWLARGDDLAAGGVSTDSRTAKAGDLFIALTGQRYDAHRFLADAAETGCVAAVVRRDAEPPPQVARRFGGGLIGVADTKQALGELAAYHRQLVSATVVAVTGSNGKTTVKGMIHHILRRRLAGSCSPKSFNNDIGLPLTLLGVEAGHDYVVCEVGGSVPGEIAALARIALPDIAVITSVAETHLAGLGSIEQVAREKASVLGYLDSNGIAVAWADSEVLNLAVRSHDCRIVRFGVADDAELRLTGYEPRAPGQRFQLNDRLWVEMPLAGRHNALNALAALAVARRFGIDQEAAATALADFEGVQMRLEWIDAGGVTIINDAYNANPASVAAAGEVLADSPGRRRVMIVGDMLELGDQARNLHAETGREIARKNIDLLLSVGPMGRHLARAAAAEGLSTSSFGSTDGACRRAARLLRRGDVVLIKGSRAMAMERLVDTIRRAFARGSASRKRKKAKGRKR